MKTAFVAVVFLLGCLSTWANPDVAAECDRLTAEGKTAECISFLNSALQTAATLREKAVVKCLLARTVLIAAQRGGPDKANRDKLLRECEKGAALAAEAIVLDPSSPDAYFWRASNWATWAQAAGGLDALGKVGLVKDDLAQALRLKPDLASAYHILGLLYASLPGWPISFGNKDYAISLLRKAIDSVKNEEEAFEMSLSLACFLWERNGSREARVSRWKGTAAEYAKRNDPADRNCHYEGGLDDSKPPVYADRPLGEMSDRDEALAIVACLEKRIKASAGGDAEKAKYLEAVDQVKKKMK